MVWVVLKVSGNVLLFRSPCISSKCMTDRARYVFHFVATRRKESVNHERSSSAGKECYPAKLCAGKDVIGGNAIVIKNWQIQEKAKKKKKKKRTLVSSCLTIPPEYFWKGDMQIKPLENISMRWSGSCETVPSIKPCKTQTRGYRYY